jgi:hypothetical protein
VSTSIRHRHYWAVARRCYDRNKDVIEYRNGHSIVWKVVCHHHASVTRYHVLATPSPLSGLNLPSWTSRAAALNETCPAFGVSWSPISTASARLSWRLSVICCACASVRRVALFLTHHPRSYYPPLNSSLPPLCLIITLLLHRPSSN